MQPRDKRGARGKLSLFFVVSVRRFDKFITRAVLFRYVPPVFCVFFEFVPSFSCAIPAECDHNSSTRYPGYDTVTRDVSSNVNLMIGRCTAVGRN